MSPAGAREIEEATMYCCIEKLYPREALDYLVCRLKNIKSLWWEDCLQKKLMNAGRIVKCARSKEGQDLLREKIKLSEELEVNYAPLFLMDNVEIFGVTQATTPEDIIRLLGATSNQ